MQQFIRIIILLFIGQLMVYAADLELKVEQQAIKLPYWAAEKPHYGGVLIVNGGASAQWSESLTHLAQLLANNGWSTVLLNCTPEIKISWIKQVPEAISALRKEKNKRIVLIHYGEELNTTLDYFSKPQGKGINGLVLLSAKDDKAIAAETEKFRFPIFDIAGQFDYEAVLNQFAERKKGFESTTYLSLKLPGADHQYNYAQELLISFLTGWMLKIPEPTVAAPPINPKSLVHSFIPPINSFASQLVAINW